MKSSLLMPLLIITIIACAKIIACNYFSAGRSTDAKIIACNNCTCNHGYSSITGVRLVVRSSSTGWLLIGGESRSNTRAANYGMRYLL